MTASPTQSVFDRVVALTFEIEGADKISLDPNDPGNWTGGEKGVGELRGTRWGISAAAYPTLDIANLDKAHATGSAFANYWLPAKCNVMPAGLAALVFDAAFQHGVSPAIGMLQRALQLHDDGAPGPKTLAAVEPLKGPAASVACVQFQVQRLLHMVEQPSWVPYHHGLAGRLFKLMSFADQINNDAEGSGA